MLMLHKGELVSAVARMLCCARSSVGRWIHWFTLYGVEGLESGRRWPFEQTGAPLKRLVERSPGDFGYQRSRWSTELLTIKINQITGCTRHPSAVRRWLPAAGLVWRRAAPGLRIRDPDRAEKMAAINAALARCCAEHPVFYEDEVDIHLNPKTGADWQLSGQQKRVVTPGQNEKYSLAGALNSGTGRVSYVGSSSKSPTLFISLLKHLRASYRRAKIITLIVDNYIIHKSHETPRWLKANPKFIVIYQPVYSPWVNHIERLWLALHDSKSTRRCRSSRRDRGGIYALDARDGAPQAIQVADRWHLLKNIVDALAHAIDSTGGHRVISQKNRTLKRLRHQPQRYVVLSALNENGVTNVISAGMRSTLFIKRVVGLEKYHVSQD